MCIIELKKRVHVDARIKALGFLDEGTRAAHDSTTLQTLEEAVHSVHGLPQSPSGRRVERKFQMPLLRFEFQPPRLQTLSFT